MIVSTKTPALLFRILKFPARIAIMLYCNRLRVNRPEITKWDGPILLAANHPNSFLDAIIMATIFKRPIYSLARGDAFKKNIYVKLLSGLNILPVYRISEGKENLGINYDTFEKCKGIFKKNGIVLIFSEGRCINEWKLRPLMKGTARLAISSWQEGIPLKVIPTGINYSNFYALPKQIDVLMSDPITAPTAYHQNGKDLQEFNDKLNQELKTLVYELPEGTPKTEDKFFDFRENTFKCILLFLPAMLGYIIHAPLYKTVKWLIERKWNNDHYDSLLVGILFISYPFYWLSLCLLIGFIFSWFYAIIAGVIIFVCAWALSKFLVR